MFEFFDIFNRAYHSVIDFVFDPLWAMYAIGILLWLAAIALCLLIGYFCMQCRLTMGKLLLVLTVGIAAFLFGAQKMRNIDNQREAAREARRRPQRDEQQTGGGFFDGWFK